MGFRSTRRRATPGHRRIALVMASSMVLGLLVGIRPAVASGSESDPGSVAAATLPEVVMECRSNQTDINHASAVALQAALGVDAPTARRVIGFRPYLAPKDILVVQGIGPDRLALILRADNTCATPTQLPPPSTEACATKARVDLASAPASEISQRLNINITAAQKIVAARPFSVLAHVTPERVPGVGKGTLDRLIAASCLTPSPVRTGEVSFRWTYRSQSTTVSRDGFELTIDPGVLDQVGAWASIRPIDHTETADDGTLATGDFPSADFHIYGVWANGDTVQVALPRDPLLDDVAGEEGWTPFLLHRRMDGSVESFSGDTLATLADGRVSARLDSLSEVDSLAQNIFRWTTDALLNGLFGLGVEAPTCDPDWPRQWGSATHVSPVDGATLDLTSVVLELPGNPSSSLYPLKHCVESSSNSTAAVTELRNNTAGIVEMRRSGWTDTPIGDEGDNPPAYVDPVGWLLRPVLTSMHPDRVYLSPGATGWFATPRAAARAVDAQPRIWPSALQIVLDDALGDIAAKVLADTRLAQSFVDISASIVRCALSEYDSFGDRGAEAAALATLSNRILNCTNPAALLDALRAGLSAQFRAGNLPGDEFNRGSLELRKVERWLKWLSIASYVVRIGDVALWDLYVPNGLVLAEHRPPRPQLDSQGRRVHEGCLSERLYNLVIDEQCQDGFYTRIATPPPGSGGGETGLHRAVIARDELGHAWLVDFDDLTGGRATARNIEDPSTYLCLVRHYKVDWDARLGDYLIRNGGPAVFDSGRDAACDWSQPATRPLNPTDPEWSSAVLREPDGTAWLAHTDGGRQHIDSTAWFADLVTDKDVRYPDGSTRNSWSEQYVWDQVTSEELSRFPLIIVGEF